MPPLRVNKFPKSFPVTAMMKLGPPISVTDCQNETLVEVSCFDIEKMAWSTPIFVPFTIEKEEFGKGGFRSAHKAISRSPLFSTKAYVVKYFLESIKNIISKVGESELDHTCKSVQMLSLTKHFSEKITAKAKNDGNEKVFGKTFKYINVSMKHVHVHQTRRPDNY